jgi:hypothetical protein
MKTGKRKASAAPKCPCCPAKQQKTASGSPAADKPETVSVDHTSQVADNNIPHTVNFPSDDISVQANASNLSTPAIIQDPGILPSDSSSDESGDETTTTFDTAVRQHLNHVLPGNGIQYQEPISTSIADQITKSIRKKILKNKYVDLASLLPTLPQPESAKYTLQMDSHANLTITPTTKVRRIFNIEQWTSAFIRFVAVYSTKFPLDTPQLMKYMEIVRDIANRRPGLAFLYYDTHFRTLRETVSIPWDRLHSEFWLMACTSFQPQQPFQPFRAARQHKQYPSQTPRRFLEGTCWNFNKCTQCNNSKCTHPHVCGYCKGSHPAYNCTTANRASTTPSQKGKSSETNRTGK